MYSKVYAITCEPQKAGAMMDYYDSTTSPAVRESAHHVGHQMVEVSPGSWLLVSNYKSQQDAKDAGPMVQALIKPLTEQYGMKLELIGEGETIREVS